MMSGERCFFVLALAGALHSQAPGEQEKKKDSFNFADDINQRTFEQV